VAELVKVDEKSLRDQLASLKEFSPKLATGLRRELRGVGAPIIAAQRAILAGPLPKGVRVGGSRVAMRRNKKTGEWGMVARNIYRDTETGSGRRGGMRDAISAGLTTNVKAGKKGMQGIVIKTTKSKAPTSILWQAKLLRHKTFGREPWQLQRGQPYFWEPLKAGHAAAALAAEKALDQALSQIK
jgi:hypothetical protein